jgi:hypothetical protein
VNWRPRRGETGVTRNGTGGQSVQGIPGATQEIGPYRHYRKSIPGWHLRSYSETLGVAHFL